VLAIAARLAQFFTMIPVASPEIARYAPDGAYAFRRLALSLLVASVAGSGMWAFVVILPKAQAAFGLDRAGASTPYTFLMFGFAVGTLALGRLVDRAGVAAPLIVAGLSIGLGFAVAGFAPNPVVFSFAHVFVGIGAGAGFAPLMADVSHWFVKRRGVAVVIVAAGNYLAGAIWPLVMNATMPLIGWRATYVGLGLIVAATVLPCALLLRRRPSAAAIAAAEQATESARAESRISPRLLMILLVLAGFSCCAAMAMPQVHIVAYCGDLGYGEARGAEMLSLMLGLGVVSRVGSGFIADAIGGAATLLIGSFMQCVALLLYLYFDGLYSLYAVSAIFGLFQGGIVPMYAVIIRELLPPREAGAKISLVVAATIIGMAFGGYISGVIFDATASYKMAFLNGVIWNAFNLAVVGWLYWRRQRTAPGARLATAG
jgi:MFS family permease